MKRNIIYIMLMALMLSACSGQHTKTTHSQSTTLETTTTTQIETQPETKDESIAGEGEAYSALNGLVVPEAITKKRPLAVMMDNYYKARPQAGLSQADIVYEVLVEGHITRYMAIFQSDMPDLIGPIRSARPYFLRLAMEYDALYAHVGGSEQAKSEIRSFKMGDIDGLASGSDTFWRKSHKPIPNNMYGSSTSLLDWAKRRKYRTEFKLDSWTFGKEYGAKDAQTFKELKIDYRKKTSKKDPHGYHIAFKYDDKTKQYKRYYNNKAHVDEKTQEQLYATSIIVQKANTRVIDSYGRLAIDIVGKGTGYYLYDGMIIPIQWKKTNDRTRTTFYTEDGKPLIMKPGKLWVQVVELKYMLNKEDSEVE